MTVGVTGVARAKACSQPGSEASGTNADEAKVSGNSQTKPARLAASTLATDSPMHAEIHEKANPNSEVSAIAASSPTAIPTTVITSTTNTIRTRSPSVRPASTAERAIGSDRKRSISPVDRSSASPTPVVVDANAVVCTKIPAIRKLAYDRPGVEIAPPNTKRNSSTKITGWTVEKNSSSGCRVVCRRLRPASTSESRTAQPRPPEGASDVVVVAVIADRPSVPRRRRQRSPRRAR